MRRIKIARCLRDEVDKDTVVLIYFLVTLVIKVMKNITKLPKKLSYVQFDEKHEKAKTRKEHDFVSRQFPSFHTVAGYFRIDDEFLFSSVLRNYLYSSQLQIEVP